MTHYDQEPNVTNRLQAQVALALLNMLDTFSPSSLSNGPSAFRGFPSGPIKLCPAV